MNKQRVKAMEVAGLILLVVGIVVWYSTPNDVIVGPILVMIAGAVLAGIAWLIGRKLDAASTNALADQIRAEREQQDNTRPGA